MGLAMPFGRPNKRINKREITRKHRVRYFALFTLRLLLVHPPFFNTTPIKPRYYLPIIEVVLYKYNVSRQKQTVVSLR